MENKWKREQRLNRMKEIINNLKKIQNKLMQII